MAPLTGDRLTQVYLQMRAKKSQLKKTYEAEVAELEKQMDLVARHLGGLLAANGVSSMAGPRGTFYYTEDVRVSVENWDLYFDHVRTADVVDVAFERRPKKEYVTEYMKLHQEPPPGVKLFREKKVLVRTK